MLSRHFFLPLSITSFVGFGALSPCTYRHYLFVYLSRSTLNFPNIAVKKSPDLTASATLFLYLILWCIYIRLFWVWNHFQVCEDGIFFSFRPKTCTHSLEVLEFWNFVYFRQQYTILILLKLNFRFIPFIRKSAIS